MTSDHSFDPRTWREASAPSPAAPVKQPAPAAEVAPRPGEPARAAWLGLSISVTILLAGAVAAYAMRPAPGTRDAASLSRQASANG